jgi:hypothetical protein
MGRPADKMPAKTFVEPNRSLILLYHVKNQEGVTLGSKFHHDTNEPFPERLLSSRRRDEQAPKHSDILVSCADFHQCGSFVARLRLGHGNVTNDDTVHFSNPSLDKPCQLIICQVVGSSPTRPTRLTCEDAWFQDRFG